MNRDQSLARLDDAAEPFDLLVVGGGATGLGTAVDAARRGHRVALLERDDFAKGTSSRSTKLVHGGVRYLRQGNVSLVLEALKERGLLGRNAPHLVHNLAFVIPAYHWWEGPFYGIGLKVYDRLAGQLGLQPSRRLDRDQTIDRIQGIETANLIGGVLYHDGQFDDARLAVHLAMTADDLGAVVANHIEVEDVTKHEGVVTGVVARDRESGRRLQIGGRCVINATGVFVDCLRQRDDPGVSNLVRASQGIHLVLPKAFLPGDAAIMVPKTADGRVLFAVPWHDRVVVGTTDTPVDTIAAEPRALDQELDFVMRHARRYLAHDPGEDDVLSVFAGLRPLVDSGGGPTAALSRDHTIVVSESGLVTVTGGKWTTYRKMAQEVVDQAEMVAGVRPRACATESLRIHGWTHARIDEDYLRPYGADAERLRQLTREQPGWLERLHPRLPYREVEVVWAAREEMARTVEDVLARRTRALLLDADASAAAAARVAELLAAELGRDPDWQARQTDQFRQLADGYRFGPR